MNRLKHTCRNGHSSTGRSTDGRFTVGCPGGPGRPRRATEKEYLAVLTEEVSPETWRAICRRAAADARARDAKARDWIARYLLGPPGELPTLWAIAEAMKAEEGARS
jgi:hypothetical protein